MMRIFSLPLIYLIRGYQRFISSYTPPRCKYYPTCSSYAITSFERHGLIKGMLLTGWRLLRCNPYSLGGIDYVPLLGKWRAAPYRKMTDEELKTHWAKLDQADSVKNIKGEIHGLV